MDAERQGADHHRVHDLSLSRPFDVRPGQVPDARGSAGLSRASRPDRPCRTRAGELGVKEDELKAIDKEIKDIVVELPSSLKMRPSPTPAELYTDVLVGSY